VKAAVLSVVMMVCAALAATLGVADLSKYQKPGEDKDGHSGMVLIAENKTPLVFFLSFAGTVPSAIAVLLESRKNRNKSKDLLVKYLQLVHKRSFPQSGAELAGASGEVGMSGKHRVSLFTPAVVMRPKFPWFPRKRVLRCEYRTGGPQPSCTWDIDPKPPKLPKGPKIEHQGLVAQAWVFQATFTVAPPIPSDHNDQKRYRDQSFMTEGTQELRSWPNAGMHAVPLLTAGSEPLAILLAESNDGTEIARSELKWDAKTMAILLGDKL
jgi:hypothetical protein